MISLVVASRMEKNKNRNMNSDSTLNSGDNWVTFGNPLNFLGSQISEGKKNVLTYLTDTEFYLFMWQKFLWCQRSDK